MPEDLDAFLISRRALSSLDAPQTPQQTTSSSSSAGSEAESSVDWEDVQGHKRAAVQQAFINNSLAFGFSAGGLVFPYYGACASPLHA
jgi:hypothetical protein